MKPRFVRTLLGSPQRVGRYIISQPFQLRNLLFFTGFIFFFLSFLHTPLASAQDSGAIGGTVTDPSGAIVAGANVEVTNADTGMVRAVMTSNMGQYGVFSLPVGLYEVHVKQSGFPEAVRTGIHLAVGQEAEVDVSLRLGEASERITVNEDAPPVSTTTADISGLVGEQQVKIGRAHV